MQQEIFKAGILKSIFLPTIIAAIMLFFYLATDIPSWALIFLIIPTVFAIGAQTTKLIIEGDLLRYQHGIFFKTNDEVSLSQVAKIVMREIETWERDSDGNHTRQINKVTYVLDDSGKTYFSFPANLLNRRNKQKFEEIITNINPSIYFS